AEHYLSIDEPTDSSVPVVLGDTAFDRTTGEELWRNDLLVFDDPGDEWNEPRTRGTLVAVAATSASSASTTTQSASICVPGVSCGVRPKHGP
ncbi:MAG: hypothetical protein WBA81_01450, partial [Rhodococcus sp. (in: high G+C Gram-positive bacteria)]